MWQKLNLLPFGGAGGGAGAVELIETIQGGLQMVRFY